MNKKRDFKGAVTNLAIKNTVDIYTGKTEETNNQPTAISPSLDFKDIDLEDLRRKAFKKPNKTKLVRLHEDYNELGKKLAAKRDMSFNTFINLLIFEAIEKEVKNNL